MSQLLRQHSDGRALVRFCKARARALALRVLLLSQIRDRFPVGTYVYDTRGHTDVEIFECFSFSAVTPTRIDSSDGGSNVNTDPSRITRRDKGRKTVVCIVIITNGRREKCKAGSSRQFCIE